MNKQPPVDAVCVVPADWRKEQVDPMNAPATELHARGRGSARWEELRLVLAQAIPSVVTTSTRGLMDVADYVLITIAGLKAAQAAVLPAQMWMWSYTVIGFGVVMMINTFAAQALGRKEHKECSAYAWQSLYIAALFGALALLFLPWLPQIVALIGHEPDVQAMEVAYLRVAVFIVGPTIAAEGLAGFFTGIHRPMVAMWTALEANVVNVAVCLVLINGWLGVPALGLVGAAVGTLVACCYRLVRLALTMLSSKYAGPFHTRETWRPSGLRLRKLLAVGAPFGTQAFAEVVVWATFVSLLVGRKFGTTHLIATNTVWQYMRIAFMPCMGVGRAVTALVGKSIGAGDPDRAMREARDATALTLIYMTVLSIVYYVFRHELVGLFNSDPEVVRIGGWIMICACVFQVFDAVGITYSGALRGAGDTLVPSAFFIVSHWLIIVGGGWCMATYVPEWGSIGPWTTAAALIVVASFFLLWRWHSRRWLKIDLLTVRDASRQEDPEAVAHMSVGGA